MTNEFKTGDNLERLRNHFLDRPMEDQAERWDSLWKTGFLPWDRQTPSPALVDALADKKYILGSALIKKSDGGMERKKVLVPGCGGGYDVLLFASKGYDAYGVDISENALNAAKKFAEENFHTYKAKAPAFGAGLYEFIFGDFLDGDDSWREKNGLDKDTRFDLIYDYTFLCALPPELRPKWSQRMSEMLAPNGRLICLEFPNWRPLSDGGPPYGLRPHFYVAHFTNPGASLPYTPEGEPEPSTYSEEAQSATSNRLALKRIEHWQPERSHSVSQGTDWMSIWAHV